MIIDSDSAVPPHQNDPSYGLQWIHNGDEFSIRPKWTVQPSIDSIILTLQERIGLGKEYVVKQCWEGVYNKIYLISYEGNRFIMRVSLPVCPTAKTESEVATLRWIHQNTTLPVPRVKCWDSSRDNPIGFEWILMDQMDGMPLSQCWHSITHEAKERIVKQIATYAADVFKKQFHEGIGNLLPSASNKHQVGEMVNMAFFWGDRDCFDHHRGPFKDASQWTESRLRLIRDDLSSRMYDTTNQNQQDMVGKMVEIVERLRALTDAFFPNSEVDSADERSAEEEENLSNKNEGMREPTLLWHNNLSLDNILVDENGVLCGIIDWECVSCLPLYEACQFPAFLQQAQDRLVEPLSPELLCRVALAQSNSVRDGLTYQKNLRQYHISLLRNIFIQEMMRRCPGWVEVFRRSGDMRDFEAAVQNCDNEFAYKLVERWVDAAEKGNG
ncbi:phosphotransferase enzyme family-domain-containing protein [Xylariaceae sp. FL0662B]|nr:phosphotransferase enzyme family-domain-containing protein [Xylariaceae sp. FL0662B]